MLSRVLGLYAYRGVNIAELALSGQIFATASKREPAKPCIVGHYSRGFEALEKGPHAKQARLLRNQVGETAQNNLKQVGLFSLIELPELTAFNQHQTIALAELKADRSQGLYYSIFHSSQIYVMGYVPFFEHRNILPAVLAHACQSYFEHYFYPDSSLLEAQAVGRVRPVFSDLGWLAEENTSYLIDQPAVLMVLGATQVVAFQMVRAMLQLSSFDSRLVEDFVASNLQRRPDVLELKGLLGQAFKPAKIGVEPLGVFLAGRRQQGSTLWGIKLSPLEAYRYLNHFMLSMYLTFGKRFFTADLEEQDVKTGITVLETEKVKRSGRQRLVSLTNYWTNGAGELMKDQVLKESLQV